MPAVLRTSDTGNNRDIEKQSRMVAGYRDAVEKWLRARGLTGD